MGRRNSDAVFLPLKTKARLNAPPTNQPWAWCTFEMLESGAMRSLSVNARRVLDRIRLEHMAHGGLENGRLKVTWLDFEKYGVGRQFIGKSIAEVVAVGIVAIERPGRMLHGQDHGDPIQQADVPSRFRRWRLHPPNERLEAIWEQYEGCKSSRGGQQAQGR
jgi:hypothetical protein